MKYIYLAVIICLILATIGAWASIYAYNRGFKDGVDYNRSHKYEIKTGSM